MNYISSTWCFFFFFLKSAFGQVPKNAAQCVSTPPELTACGLPQSDQQ